MVSDEQRVEIEREIVRVVLQVEKKVDNVSGFIRHCEATAKNIDAEIARLKALKAHYASGETRCKGYVADIIRAAGKDAKGKYRPLEGKTSVMRLQANGGVQALEITDPSAIPDENCHILGSLSFREWKTVYDLVVGICGPHSKEAKWLCDFKREPDTALLRSALMEPCPMCQGKKIVDTEAADGGARCGSCAGDGLNRVPGARLLPRGESLHVC
jgi:hypothetical protein